MKGPKKGLSGPSIRKSVFRKRSQNSNEILHNIDLIKQATKMNRKLSQLAQRLEEDRDFIHPHLMSKNKVVNKYKKRAEERKREQDEREKLMQENFERFRKEKLAPKLKKVPSRRLKPLNLAFKREKEAAEKIKKEAAKKEKDAANERVKALWRVFRVRTMCLFRILISWRRYRRDLEEKRGQIRNLFKIKLEDALGSISLIFYNCCKRGLEGVWGMELTAENCTIWEEGVRKEYGVAQLGEDLAREEDFIFSIQNSADEVHVKHTISFVLISLMMLSSIKHLDFSQLLLL